MIELSKAFDYTAFYDEANDTLYAYVALTQA